MSKEIKISDWVTEEEFNYSPTGELSAVLYLAEQRSEWFAKGEKAAEERIIKLLKEHEAISDGSEGGDYAICVCQHWSLKAEPYVDHIEQLIKGEQK